MPTNREVNVKINVKPGSTSEFDKLVAARTRGPQQQINDWEIRSNGAGRQPVTVKAEKRSFADAFSPVLRGIAGQMAGRALGGGIGGLVGGGMAGGGVGMALAAIPAIKDLSGGALFNFNARLSRLNELVHASTDTLGAQNVAYQNAINNSRAYNWMLRIISFDTANRTESLEGQRQLAQQRATQVGILSPGTLHRQNMAVEDLQAAQGMGHKGEVENATRQTRLLADLELTRTRLTEDQQKALFKSAKQYLEKTEGLSAAEAREARRRIKEETGIDIASATGLAARPASFVGANEYAKSVYQAAFQSGVDPAQQAAQASAFSLNQIWDLLRQFAANAAGRAGEAIQAGR